MISFLYSGRHTCATLMRSRSMLLRDVLDTDALETTCTSRATLMRSRSMMRDFLDTDTLEVCDALTSWTAHAGYTDALEAL
eukprot:s3882_g8.t1